MGGVRVKGGEKGQGLGVEGLWMGKGGRIIGRKKEEGLEV